MASNFDFSDDEHSSNKANDGPSFSMYEIFGVKPDASMDDIKTAYKKLVKKYHPDKHKTEKEKYTKILQNYNKMFDILKAKHERKQNQESPKSDNVTGKHDINIKNIFIFVLSILILTSILKNDTS
mmetsp:Transcript_78176/g.95722  ORF Transcript_78176/g.95722 Transcript_78176/m.95722 type:complete len:126 (-) Transcript_78176:379-756(-)